MDEGRGQLNQPAVPIDRDRLSRGTRADRRASGQDPNRKQRRVAKAPLRLPREQRDDGRGEGLFRLAISAWALASAAAAPDIVARALHGRSAPPNLKADAPDLDRWPAPRGLRPLWHRQAPGPSARPWPDRGRRRRPARRSISARFSFPTAEQRRLILPHDDPGARPRGCARCRESSGLAQSSFCRLQYVLYRVCDIR